MIHWDLHNIEKAGQYFKQCGDEPNYPPFYAARATFLVKNKIAGLEVLSDLKHAMNLDPIQWRYGRQLAAYYLSERQLEEALSVSGQ